MKRMGCAPDELRTGSNCLSTKPSIELRAIKVPRATVWIHQEGTLRDVRSLPCGRHRWARCEHLGWTLVPQLRAHQNCLPRRRQDLSNSRSPHLSVDDNNGETRSAES